MKKVFAAVITLLFAVLMIAGCGGGSYSPSLGSSLQISLSYPQDKQSTAVSYYLIDIYEVSSDGTVGTETVVPTTRIDYPETTAAISEVPAGSMKILVNGYNEEGKLTYSGSTIQNIASDGNNVVEITVSPVNLTVTTTHSSITFISSGSNLTEGTYPLKITQEPRRGKVTSSSGRNTVKVSGGSGTGATLAVSETITFSGALVGPDKTLTFGTGDGIDEVVAAINSDTQLSNAGITAQKNDLNGLDVLCNRLSGGGAAELFVVSNNPTIKDITGIPLTGEASATKGCSIPDVLREDETLTFGDSTGDIVSVNILEGQTIGQGIDEINKALTSAGVPVFVEWDDTNDLFVISTDDYGTSDALAYYVKSNVAGTDTNTGIGPAADVSVIIADGSGAGAQSGQNVAGVLGTVTGTGLGSTLSFPTGQPFDEMKLNVEATSPGDYGEVIISTGN